MLVDLTFPGGYQGQFASNDYYVMTFSPAITIWPFNRYFLLTDPATASIPIYGYRSLKNQELIEGKTFPYGDPGKGIVSVLRSRWKIFGGSSEAVLKDPLATQSELLFPAKGFVEVAHDVALSYDWADEHYEMEFKPESSGLFGVFPYKSSAKFAQMPPGIIFNTSRLVKFQEVDLTIDGERRVISAMNGNLAKVDPPIILGQSALFPNSKPLSAEWFYLVFERRIKNTTELLPMITDFQTALKYDKLEQATGTEMLIRPDLLFMPLSNAKLGKGNSWDLTPLLTPLTDWLSVKAFNNPAEIVQVNIDPTEPEVFEGQKFEFTGSIVPKPGLGTGEITDKGGSLDLLDGYESQTVEKLDWDALFHPHQDLWKTGSGFDFQFEPKKGTGTYEILASTVVSLKEKDTGSLAKASGISSTTALVKPGFRILTPLEKFAYPVGMPIKVTTTQDGEAAWASITWSMNGKPWKPQEQEAPATFIPDKEGDWVLAGELIVKDENDQDVVLQDKVKFPVKPVTIQLSPVRKVVSPHPKAVPFTLLVKLGKTEITNTNQVVEWAPKTMSAKIETIEWKGFTSPTTAVDMSGLDPLTREANLKNDGPMTVLATVTVRFWSTDPQKPFDETFSFPAARADLWAVPEPSWKTVEGHLFLNAIAGAKRTFAPKTGSFNLGNDTHSWSIEHGVDPEISLAPARE